MDSEKALRQLGPYSKWQLRTYFIYAFGFGVPAAWMIMSVVFIGDTPGHRCAISANATLNESIPQTCDDEGKCKYEQCIMYKDPRHHNGTIPCTNGYWYDRESGYESTLVTEFDLVCSKDSLVELSMSLSGVGAALGALIVPTLSDKFGRKPIFLACMWSNTIIAIVQAFSINMAMYTVLSFIDGFQQQGMASAAAVLAIELFPTEQRTFAGVAIDFFWAFGYVTLLPFAYYIRNWRYLLLAITLPMTLTLSFYWLIPESIPWLVANDKTKKAERILGQAAKVNGLTIPESTLSPQKQQSTNLVQGTRDKVEDQLVLSYGKCDEAFASDKEKGTGFRKMLTQMQTLVTKEEDVFAEVHIPQYSGFDIVRNKTMLTYAIVLSFQWFLSAVTYGSMVLTVTFLPGNRYINFFLYAVMEVPVYVLIWIMMLKIGRRISIALCDFVSGVAILGTVALLFGPESMNWLMIVCNLIGKSAVTMSFAAVYVYTPELYPTNIRTTGLGLAQFSGKMGSMIAPYARILIRTNSWMFPMLIGVLSLVTGFLVLILPETRHEPLPHTIEQVEFFKRRR